MVDLHHRQRIIGAGERPRSRAEFIPCGLGALAVPGLYLGRYGFDACADCICMGQFQFGRFTFLHDGINDFLLLSILVVEIEGLDHILNDRFNLLREAVFAFAASIRRQVGKQMAVLIGP